MILLLLKFLHKTLQEYPSQLCSVLPLTFLFSLCSSYFLMRFSNQKFLMLSDECFVSVPKPLITGAVGWVFLRRGSPHERAQSQRMGSEPSSRPLLQLKGCDCAPDTDKIHPHIFSPCKAIQKECKQVRFWLCVILERIFENNDILCRCMTPACSLISGSTHTKV